MTDNFIKRIISERTVDTANYRYVFESTNSRASIKRLNISALDTTRALSDWETVKVWDNPDDIKVLFRG